MIRLKTISRPRGAMPWPSREYIRDIEEEAREMSWQAQILRVMIDGGQEEETREMGWQEQVLRVVIDGGQEEETLGGELLMALLHLCNYLDGATRADHEDEFGIACPRRWEPWYSAHLFRTAVHFLERGQLTGNIEGDLNRNLAANLAASLADLAARVMHLQATPGARKTMDAVMRGELWQ